MTKTQVPIIGAAKRFLSLREELALLGLPTDFALPTKNADAYAALGNGVHARVVEVVARQLVRGVSKIALLEPCATHRIQDVARVTRQVELVEACS
jgi:hypothetical protein